MDHIQIRAHDVFISYVDLPGDITGLVTSTVDGYNILINQNLSRLNKVRVLQHEINHIIRNHIESPKFVQEIEEDYE